MHSSSSSAISAASTGGGNDGTPYVALAPRQQHHRCPLRDPPPPRRVDLRLFLMRCLEDGLMGKGKSTRPYRRETATCRGRSLDPSIVVVL